jgi:Tfp pilus assembly protein PilF
MANTPTNPEPYRSLYVLYTYQYKTDTTSAERILLKGIEATPQAIDLTVLLAQYYRAHNQPTQAAQQYDVAIAAAQKAGNTALAQELQAEKAQL